MLEGCVALEDCERLLAEKLENIGFLGEVELSSKDVKKLSEMIRERIKNDTREGLAFLRRYTPTCLALLLVGLGIWEYREGTYWPAVAEVIGFDGVGSQVRLGRFFLEYLKERGLQESDFEQESEPAWRYVTPILMHGGIRQHCLKEFFSSIVLRLLSDDIVDADDVKDWLYSIRGEVHYRRDLQKELQGLEEKKKKLEEKCESLARLDALLKEAEGLDFALPNPEELEELPDDCAAFLEENEGNLRFMQRQISELEKKQRICRQAIQEFTVDDRNILELAAEIEECVKNSQGVLGSREELRRLQAEEEKFRKQLETLMHSLWRTSWDDCYQEPLAGLNWELLGQKCREYQELFSYRRGLCEKLTLLCEDDSRLHPGFWMGAFFLFGGVGLMLSPYLWPGALLLSTGLAIAASAFSLWHKERRRKARREQEREALQDQITDAEERLRQLEGEIGQLVVGLPITSDWGWALGPEVADVLGDLRKAFEGWQECSRKILEMETVFAAWERQVREVAAASLGTVPLSDEEAVLERLIERLSEAREREKKADLAERALREEVDPRLKELREEEKRSERELCRVKARLLVWGRGDLEEGIRELALKRRIYHRRQEIAAEVRDLARLLGMTYEEVAGEGVERLRLSVEEELERICRDIREKEEELRRSPSYLPAVTKPVERFLVFGGVWAEKWLWGAVRLADLAFRGKEISEEDYGLPGRVVEWFVEWFLEDKPEKGTKPEKYAEPVLKLDLRHHELLIGYDSCRLPLHGKSNTKVFLKIDSFGVKPDGGNPQSQELLLRLYQTAVGCVETEAVECPVPLAESYGVSLIVDDKAVSWEIAGIKEKPFLAFDENGRLIDSEQWPRRRLWLLVLSGHVLSPSVPVIEDATPPWISAYRVFLVDLSSVTDAYLVDRKGVKHPISLAEGKEFEPYLEGGELVPCAAVGGAPVYASAPTTLVIPKSAFALGEDTRLLIRQGLGLGVERKRWLLKELPDDSIQWREGRVEVSLATPELLGPEPAGVFTLRLRAARRREDVFHLAVIPDLLVIFEPQLLLPFAQSGELATLTVIVPENVVFELEPPAEVISREDDAYEITVPVEKDQVRGWLRMEQPLGEMLLPLAIRLPFVRWRLQGLEGHRFSTWQRCVQELWIGDIDSAQRTLFLELVLPDGVGERAELHLSDSLQYAVKNLKNGYTRFNLLDFTESLWAGEEPLRTFSIKIYGQRQRLIFEGPLLQIRCRWTVEEVRWEVEDLPSVRRLKIE